MSIQHLEKDPKTQNPIWVHTAYATLKEAREDNPAEPPNFFRVSPLKTPF